MNPYLKAVMTCCLTACCMLTGCKDNTEIDANSESVIVSNQSTMTADVERCQKQAKGILSAVSGGTFNLNAYMSFVSSFEKENYKGFYINYDYSSYDETSRDEYSWVNAGEWCTCRRLSGLNKNEDDNFKICFDYRNSTRTLVINEYVRGTNAEAIDSDSVLIKTMGEEDYEYLIADLGIEQTLNYISPLLSDFVISKPKLLRTALTNKDGTAYFTEYYTVDTPDRTKYTICFTYYDNSGELSEFTVTKEDPKQSNGGVQNCKFGLITDDSTVNNLIVSANDLDITNNSTNYTFYDRIENYSMYREFKGIDSQ